MGVGSVLGIVRELGIAVNLADEFSAYNAMALSTLGTAAFAFCLLR